MPGPYDTFSHRWFDEVWNEGNTDTIDEMLHPEMVAHGLSDTRGQEIPGVDAFKVFHQNLRSAVPDLNVTVEQTVAEGEFMVARCRVRGTHTGEGLGFPASGRPVDFSGMTMMRIVDNRVVENWDCYDFLTLMQQVGMVNLAGE